MSRNIFSSLMLVVMMLVLVTGNIQAQTQVNANINATATIMAAITITKNTDVAFGNLGATTAGAVVLSPLGIGSSNYVGSTAAAGTITITAANTTHVVISWPATVTMTSGGNTMTLTLAVNGNTVNTQSSSTAQSSGSGSTITSGTGQYYLWVGGSLGTLASQVTGSYTGPANFTVEYQ